MSKLTISIGNNIRLYRKNKLMNMEQLAAKINKSKPTVSKYERGAISIDIDTLYDIASALQVSIDQLIEHSPSGGLKETSGQKLKKHFLHNTLYLYLYDGRTKRMTKGLIQTYYDESAQASRATMYMDVDSFADYKNCKTLYYGTAEEHDIITNLILQNQANGVEVINIIALNPLNGDEVMRALLCGISSSPFVPVSFRCIISAKPLPENDALDAQLQISRDDLKVIKKYNFLAGQSLQ